jgi:hypothetical protein
MEVDQERLIGHSEGSRVGIEKCSRPGPAAAGRDLMFPRGRLEQVLA